MRRSGGSRSGKTTPADSQMTPSTPSAFVLPDELFPDLGPEQQATITMAPPESPQQTSDAQPRLLPERSRSIRASVYRQGARVSYDPDLHALRLEFLLWPLHSPEDVELACATLRPRVSAITTRRGLGRLPLLLDIAGFEVAPDLQEHADRALNDLIGAICPALPTSATPIRPFVIRYDSRLTLTPRQRAASIKRIESAYPSEPNALLSLLHTPRASREEAAALLLRLRTLSAAPTP